jgi:hypothetical protein
MNIPWHKLANALTAALLAPAALALLRFVGWIHNLFALWLVTPVLVLGVALALYTLLISKAPGRAAVVGAVCGLFGLAGYFQSLLTDEAALTAASCVLAGVVGGAAFFLWATEFNAELVGQAGKKFGDLLMASPARCYVPALVLALLVVGTAISARSGWHVAVVVAVLLPAAVVLLTADRMDIRDATRVIGQTPSWSLPLVAATMSIALTELLPFPVGAWCDHWPGWTLLTRISLGAFVVAPTSLAWILLCWLPLLLEAPGIRRAAEAAAKEKNHSMSEVLRELRDSMGGKP